MITAFLLRHGIKAAIALLFIGAIFGLGYAAANKIKNGEISDIQKEIAHARLALAEEKTRKAEANSMAAQAALKQIETAAYVMRSAVDSYNLDQKNVTAKLSGISQELRGLKVSAPLPVDCKPDTGRINSFKNSIDATNSAIKR